MSKNWQEPRTRTEADELSQTKTPFQKFMHKKDKEERSSKGKYPDKTKHFLETKNLNLKKLNLGAHLCNSPITKTTSPKTHPWRK